MRIQKATEVAKLYQALLQKPLRVDEIDDFFIETSKSRGDKPRNQMMRLLRQNVDTYQHILLVGYSGCGKSTELKRLEKDLQNAFVVFNYSVFDELDPNSINYVELVVITMERLFEFVNRQDNISVSPSFTNQLGNFLKTKEIEELRVKYMDVEAAVETEAGLGVPYFAKFFASLRGTSKSSRQVKTALKENVEPKYKELLGYCNQLIDEITKQVKEDGKKGLLIIVEDLDKIKIEESEKLFFNYASQITDLEVNVIYTFPIGLYYNTKFRTIKDKFSKIYELPMIKLRNRQDQSVNQLGVDTMKEIVLARMNEELLADGKSLEGLILLSGGCLRDLFLMLVEAAESAQDNNRTVIEPEDVDYAVKKLKRDYRNTIADKMNDKGEVLISSKEYYDTLVELAKNDLKDVENTDTVMDLRQSLCILGYNGDGWCDVHPIVKQILTDKNLL